MVYKTETVSGTIKYVGCARFDGNDNFSIVLEENPYQIYTGNKNPRLAIARVGQYVSMSVETIVADIKNIRGFALVPKPE